ncbi:hypothetical protein ACFL6Y_08045 [Elusimicrobiota bacterium]
MKPAQKPISAINDSRMILDMLIFQIRNFKSTTLVFWNKKTKKRITRQAVSIFLTHINNSVF